MGAGGRRRMQQLNGTANGRPALDILSPLRSAERPAKIPVSESQRMHLRLQAERAPLRLSIYRRIRGPLEPAALQAAFRALLQRNEILRTRYLADDAGTWQEISEPRAGDIEIRELNSTSAAE